MTHYLKLQGSDELIDGDIILTPTNVEQSKDYLFEIATRDKYSKATREQMEYATQFIKYVWIGRTTEGILGGIIFMNYFDNLGWTFDAYQERDNLKKINNKGNFSCRSAQLVIDWFWRTVQAQKLYTIHRIENRGATILCKVLGFKVIEEFNGFVKMVVEHGS